MALRAITDLKSVNRRTYGFFWFSCVRDSCLDCTDASVGSCWVVGSITTSWPQFWVEIKAKPLAPISVQGTRFGFVSVGFGMLAQGIVSRTSSGVGNGNVRVKLYGQVVIPYRPLVLSQSSVSKGTAVVGFG